MPRKMAGIAMITIEASIVAIVMLSVVFDRTIHRYRSGRPLVLAGADDPAEPSLAPALCRTLTHSTARHLLDGNYSSEDSGFPALARTLRVGRRGRRALRNVVHGDQGDQDERGDGVERGDHDGDHVDAAAADEPQPRAPVRLGRQWLERALAVQRPFEDRAETDRHAKEHPGVEHHGDPRVPAVALGH